MTNLFILGYKSSTYFLYLFLTVLLFLKKSNVPTLDQISINNIKIYDT